MSLAQVALLSAVDLDELDVLLLEESGGLLVLRSESLAVTAPGGEDYQATQVSKPAEKLPIDKMDGSTIVTYTQRGRARYP